MELTTIRQDVFKHISKQSQIVLIDDCIALIIAEVLGYINTKNSHEFGEWSSICFKIKDFKGLTKEGLLHKIKSEILDKISIKQKQQLLGNKAIYEFDGNNLRFNDEPYFRFKNATSNLRTNYGEKPYLPNLKSTKLTIENKSTYKVKQTILNKVLSEEEAALNIFWKHLETEERKRLFPFWKWRINTNDYKELENKLTSLLTKFDQKDVVDRHAFKLALYYAEWYKREYIGNNSKKNKIFEEIKLESIWDSIDDKIKSKYLYKVNTSERRDNSLQLLGGLPLSYITSEDKNSNLSLKFSKLFRDINSNKSLNLEGLGLNNQSMNKSAHKGGSLYEFIQELLDGKLPFAESDMELSPFKEFKLFVEEGIKNYKEEQKKKFTVNWFVEQHSTFEYIYPYLQINLRPGEGDEGHRFITKDRLTRWGIENDITHFSIIVRLNFNDSQRDYKDNFFNLCANGKFISRSGNVWKISISDLSEKPLSVEFILNAEGVEKTIQKEEIPRFVQLWSVGFCQWQNRAINGKQSAVLFLCNDAFTKKTEQSKEWITKNSTKKYRWAVINKEIIIIDKNKEIKLFTKDGDIEVTPRNFKPFSNSINYLEDGKVKYTQEEYEKNVYLLKGKVEFIVKFIPKIIYRDQSEIEGLEEYTVEYMTPVMSEYKVYDIETVLSQGYVRFKVTYKAYSKIIECYWLPESSIINRDVHSEKIVFKEINTLELLKNQYTDKEENLGENYIRVKVGNEKSYIEFEMFRPLNRSNDLLVNGEYNASKDVIPIKFVDKFVLRVIDAGGLVLHNLSNKIEKYQKLRVIYNNNNPSNKLQDDQTGIVGEPNLPKLKTYTKKVEYNNGFYYLPNSASRSINEFAEYNFYYLPLDSNEPKKIGLKFCVINNKNYIGFSMTEKTNGIVFQSLKTEIFQETYRPFFVSSSGSNIKNNIKIDDRVTRILKYKDNFDKDLYDLAIKHFNLAVEHELYFGMFDVFWALQDNPLLLAKFYLEYFQEMQNIGIKYDELHRFAQEFLFDWMLIPRKVWLEAIGQMKQKEKQEWVIILFKQKKIHDGAEVFKLNECLKIYWELSHNNNNSGNLFYKNINRSRKLDAYFKSEAPEKIKVLKSIDDSQTIYANLLETLNN